MLARINPPIRPIAECPGLTARGETRIRRLVAAARVSSRA